MARWLRLWMSYLRTAGLAMAVFTALALVYGAIRLGPEWLSVIVFGAGSVALSISLLLYDTYARWRSIAAGRRFKPLIVGAFLLRKWWNKTGSSESYAPVRRAAH